MCKECSSRPVRCRGLCSTCYFRARRRGWFPIDGRKKITVPSCHPDREHCAKGLCVSCYRRANYDPEVARRRNREYDLRHPGRRRASFLRWQKNNPEKNCERTRRRRALRLRAPICDFTLQEWFEIKKRYGYRCAYCGEQKPLERDHSIPLSRGGSHTASNIVPACRSCNSRKKDRTVEEFLRKEASAA